MSVQDDWFEREAAPVGPLEGSQQRPDNENVENLARGVGMRDIKDNFSFDVAMKALIEVEDDAPIGAL